MKNFFFCILWNLKPNQIEKSPISLVEINNPFRTMISFATSSRRHSPTAVSTVTIDQRQQVVAFQNAQSSVICALQRMLIFIHFILVSTLSSVLRGLRLLWHKTERVRDHYAEQFVRNLMSPTAIFVFIFWPGWLVIGAVCLIWKISG